MTNRVQLKVVREYLQCLERLDGYINQRDYPLTVPRSFLRELREILKKLGDEVECFDYDIPSN